ncbi:hypothetical protein [Nitrospira sp. Ecomares 2.1]
MDDSSVVERGRNLIKDLKSHVIDTFSKDPRGRLQGEGLGNSEIEKLAGLEIPLDRPPSKKQEHWLTWTIVQRLVADGFVEPVFTKKQNID